MKIVIPGGTGQIGTMLARAFLADGHQVVVLSRNPRKAPWPVVCWDPTAIGDWVDEIDGADVLINLAGRSVNCRYSARNRHLMMESRVVSTRVVGQAITKVRRPPSQISPSCPKVAFAEITSLQGTSMVRVTFWS